MRLQLLVRFKEIPAHLIKILIVKGCTRIPSKISVILIYFVPSSLQYVHYAVTVTVEVEEEE
jgi:hypothetical protein